MKLSNGAASKNFKILLLFIVAIFLTLGVSISLQTVMAALVETVGTSFHVGNTGINVGNGQNLLWGEIGAGDGNGSFILLQKAGVDKLRVDHNGNLTAAGTVYANGQALCQANGTNCPAVTNVDTVDGVHLNSNSWPTVGGVHFYGVGGDSGQGADAYGIFQEGGAWSYPYPDLRIAYHTGIKLGANASYNGIRFYNDYDMSGLVMSINDSATGGANNIYIPNIAYVGDLRAGIMYDWNDTGYYLDPNGTSNINRITNRTKASFGNNGLYNTPRWDYTGDTRYWTGAMGWGTTDFNTIYSNWGSGFFDTWSSPGNAPGGSSHYVGLQGFHFNHGDGTNAYGFQMAMAGEANNRFFWRSGWPSPRSWVEMIHTGNIGSQTVGFANSVAWSNITSRPAGLDDGDQVGITSETDPSVPAVAKGLNQWVNTNSDPTFNSVFLANGNLRLYQGPGTALHIQTAYGYTDFGAQNSGWTHIYSDKNFYMNQNLYLYGNRVYADNYRPYADSAGSATNATNATNATYSTYVNTDSYNMKMHWSGQGGQPTWLWGSNNGSDSYVWNPSNFSVNYANSAGSANSIAWGNISGRPAGLDDGDQVGMGGSGTANYLPKFTAATTLGNSQIYDNGTNVGIGTAGPGYKMDVVGDVRANSFVYSSDRSLKNSVETISDALGKVIQLNGISFRWEKDGRQDLGLIAQEVEAVFPELVRTDQTTNLKSLEYGNLVAPLIEAIKEQQRQIEALRAEIENMKNLEK